MKLLTAFCALLIATAFVRHSPATIVYSVAGSTYSQNFDSLASTGPDNAWQNDGTLPGWSLYRITAANNPAPFAIDTYYASSGITDNGRFYSLGNSSDRALGGVGANKFGTDADFIDTTMGQTLGWIAASFSNGTGSPLTNITFNYDGEQWRNGGNDNGVAQAMAFEYAFGSDFATIPSNAWNVPTGDFTFSSPTNSGLDGPLNGNLAANSAADRGGTISNLDWQPGATLWLRWIERNDTFIDHGLAIDNFEFSASATISAVPEASAVACGGIACIAIGGVHLLRRRLGRWPKSGVNA